MLDDIAFQAKLQPKKLALHDLKSDRKWDYEALDRMVSLFSGVLLEHGLDRGHRLVGDADPSLLVGDEFLNSITSDVLRPSIDQLTLLPALPRRGSGEIQKNN
jgi:hypothetical protein